MNPAEDIFVYRENVLKSFGFHYSTIYGRDFLAFDVNSVPHVRKEYSTAKGNKTYLPKQENRHYSGGFEKYQGLIVALGVQVLS